MNVVAMAHVVVKCPIAECALGAEGARYKTSDSRFAGGDPASPGLRVRAVEVSLPAL